MDTKNQILLNAIRSGDTAIVKHLVSGGIDLNCPDDGSVNEPFLMCAARTGRLDIVEYLINEGADVNHPSKDDETALMIASLCGHPDIVKLLLDKGADPDAQDSYGNTSLLWAAKKDNCFIIKLLLDAGADIEKSDGEGFSAFAIAAKNQSLFTMKRLMDAGANINTSSDNNTTPLFYAIYHDHKDVALMLIDAEADQTILPSYSKSLLSSAAHGNNKKIVEALIKKGATTLPNWEYYPLLAAIERDHHEIVSCLLDNGANPNICAPEHSVTNFMRAAGYGSLEIMDILFNRHADINAKDKRGLTALMYAVRNNREEAVNKIIAYGAEVNEIAHPHSALSLAYDSLQEYTKTSEANERKKTERIIKSLVKAGADINLPYKDGNTVFMQALRHEKYTLAATLLKKSTNLDIQNAAGETALMILARNSTPSESLCKKMLSMKSNLDIQDSFGNTALMYAISSRNKGIAKLILSEDQNLSLKNWHMRKTALELADELKLEEIASIIESKILDESIAQPAQNAQHELSF